MTDKTVMGSSKKLAVRLLKDVYDDGQDHHPSGYVGRKGDVVFIHSIQTAVVSHDGTGHGFIVHDGELELTAEHAPETNESPDAERYRYLKSHLGLGWGVKLAGGDPHGFAGPTLLDKALDAARGAQKAFVHLCAPHGKDWLTCPECAKAAVNACGCNTEDPYVCSKAKPHEHEPCYCQCHKL